MSLSKKSWIGTIVIFLMMITVAYFKTNEFEVNASLLTDDSKPVTISESLLPQPIVFPKPNRTEEKITLLSQYIKGRKSATPQVVADLIATEIITQCQANYIADDIVVGIIEIESMWNIYATSKAKPVSAKGLMQILIEDGVDIDHDKAYNISYNIEKGIAIFKSKLQKANGDVSLALKYYVGGDPEYHKAVYKYLGMYTLFKINNSKLEISKAINIIKG